MQTNISPHNSRLNHTKDIHSTRVRETAPIDLAFGAHPSTLLVLESSEMLHVTCDRTIQNCVGLLGRQCWTLHAFATAER